MKATQQRHSDPPFFLAEKNPIMMRSFASLRMTIILLCGLLLSGHLAHADTKTKIRIGHFPNLTHAQGVIGHEDGWFEKSFEGVAKVQWKVFNAGPSVIEAIFAGALDIAYIGPNPAINGYVKSRGEAIRIIAGA